MRMDECMDHHSFELGHHVQHTLPWSDLSVPVSFFCEDGSFVRMDTLIVTALKLRHNQQLFSVLKDKKKPQEAGRGGCSVMKY